MHRVYQDNYLEDRVMSATPMELVRLLYGGAIEAVDRARECLASGDIAGRARAITKAVAITGELAHALQPAEGAPEVEQNLRRLYEFVIHRLNEGNLSQTDAPLADARRVLVTLAEAWSALGEPLAETRSAAAGQLAVQG
jgi:flagellar protein FliS